MCCTCASTLEDCDEIFLVLTEVWKHCYLFLQTSSPSSVSQDDITNNGNAQDTKPIVPMLQPPRPVNLAQAIGSSGRQLAKNILALDCKTGYARLLENVLSFPSDTLLTGPVSQI
ncbi:hypothetical protein VNO77_18965 [Canavalia gladiata]|uniref:Uncharacterized protein n=1 Tax=Canavalia gladiata TaxID=3824 RepID=A0AAN9QP64_CANGL